MGNKNEMMVFNNEVFGKVRVVNIDGECWFIGKDVVDKLGYSVGTNYSDVIKHYCNKEDYILLNKNSSLNWGVEFNYKELGRKGAYLVNERGLYKLITYSKNVSVMKKEKIIELIKEIGLIDGVSLSSFRSREENELLDSSTENKNEMMVFNNEMFGKVRVINIDGDAWLAGKDVVEILGYSVGKSNTYSEYLKKYVDEEDMLFLDKNVQFKQGVSFNYKELGQRGGYLVNGCGLYKLITYSQNMSVVKKEKIIEWFKEIGLIDGVSLSSFRSRKEINFLDRLENALIPFGITGVKQYRVLNYKIDYYIPSLNIAIEYDENGHKNYTYEAHELRQKLIEEELGCMFIRVIDKNNDDYNIGLVIKQLLKYGLLEVV